MSPFAIELRRLTIAVLLAVTLTMLTTARWASADEPYSFASKWGTEGPNTGQFMRPFGATVDRYGNVYVADKGNNRIQKFTSRGTFLLE